VTKQTGPAASRSGRVYIEDGADIDRELYLALLVDRASSRVAFVVSQEGGMDIEEVAHATPERILTLTVDPSTGYQPTTAAASPTRSGLSGSQVKQCVSLMGKLYDLFLSKDMEMLEINPLIVTKAGALHSSTPRWAFDNNALSRHPDVAALADETEVDPKELAAQSSTSTTSRSTARSAAW
jgi:succinyl-CoA synthetase beta subunit